MKVLHFKYYNIKKYYNKTISLCVKGCEVQKTDKYINITIYAPNAKFDIDIILEELKYCFVSASYADEIGFITLTKDCEVEVIEESKRKMDK